jgi:predicted O-linked N-acetylglucosamine transferase (SPINDLY family)
VTPAAIRAWAAILTAVPSSRLLVAVPGDPACHPRLRHLLALAGVPPDCCELVARTPSWQQYLERYNRIDIALDPFPYAGTTTTCDAMWMGVPTVTLAGQTHVSRTGVSLLNAVGLPELIAQTKQEYVQIAVKLASDPQHLSTLRERMRRSPLCDGPGLAVAIGDAFAAMWQRRVAR